MSSKKIAIDYDLFSLDTKPPQKRKPPKIKNPPNNNKISPEGFPFKNTKTMEIESTIQTKLPNKKRILVNLEEKNHQPISVKMFQLENNDWIDKGFIGNLAINKYKISIPNENKQTINKKSTTDQIIIMQVTDITNDIIVVNHLVSKSISYHRDGDTIITWAEGLNEVAMSFKAAKDCEETFYILKSVKSENMIDTDKFNEYYKTGMDLSQIFSELLEIKQRTNYKTKEIDGNDDEETNEKFWENGVLDKQEDSNKGKSRRIEANNTELSGTKLNNNLQNGPNLQNINPSSIDSNQYSPPGDPDNLLLYQTSIYNPLASPNYNLILQESSEEIKPKLANLDKILQIVRQRFSVANRMIIQSFKTSDYTKKWFDLIEKLEDFGDFDGLEKIYHIFRTALYSDEKLCNWFLSPENIDGFISAYEYRPDNIQIALSENKDICSQYRDSLKQPKMKIAPLNFDEELMNDIIYTQKLTFLLDFVFFNPADRDNVMQMVEFILSQQRSKLLNHLFEKNRIKNFVSDTYLKVKNLQKYSNNESKNDIIAQKESYQAKFETLRSEILFLAELFNLIKQQPVHSEGLIKNLPFLELLQAILSVASPVAHGWCWLIVVEIIDILIIVQSTSALHYIMNNGYTFGVDCNAKPPDTAKKESGKRICLLSHLVDVLSPRIIGKNDKLCEENLNKADHKKLAAIDVAVITQSALLLRKITGIMTFSFIIDASKFSLNFFEREVPRLIDFMASGTEFLSEIKNAPETNEPNSQKLSALEKNNQIIVLTEMVYQSVLCLADQVESEITLKQARRIKVMPVVKVSMIGRALFHMLPLIGLEIPRLTMSALRLLKSCLSSNMEQLTKLFVLNDFVPNLARLVYSDGIRKDNLISSAVWDIFKFATTRRIMVVLTEVFERCQDIIKLEPNVFEGIAEIIKESKSNKKRSLEGSLSKKLESEINQKTKPNCLIGTNRKFMTSEELYFSDENEFENCDANSAENNIKDDGFIERKNFKTEKNVINPAGVKEGENSTKNKILFKFKNTAFTSGQKLNENKSGYKKLSSENAAGDNQSGIK